MTNTINKWFTVSRSGTILLCSKELNAVSSFDNCFANVDYSYDFAVPISTHNLTIPFNVCNVKATHNKPINPASQQSLYQLNTSVFN